MRELMRQLGKAARRYANSKRLPVSTPAGLQEAQRQLGQSTGNVQNPFRYGRPTPASLEIRG